MVINNYARFFMVAVISTFMSCSNDSSKEVTINGVTSKTIPGLTAADITGNFEKSGFLISKNLEGKPNTWTAKKFEYNKDYNVMASGDGPFKIISVDGSFIYGGKGEIEKESSSFLGYVASLPYKDAEPQAAKEWAIRNCGSGGDTIIAGVRFRIIASSSTRVIKISM